jgi:transcriptional regulator with XRE-family HTH domain
VFAIASTLWLTVTVSRINAGSIGEYIRQQRERANISLRQLASAAGVSNPYLSQIERGLRRPSAEILQQIAKGLRISAEALYVQAGILEDRYSESGVRMAVLADPGLTERQKQVLLEIYESFRKETAEDTAEGELADEAGPRPDGAEPDEVVSSTVWADVASEDLAGQAAVDPGVAGPNGAGPDMAEPDIAG